MKTTNEKPQTKTALFGRAETERASKLSKRRAGVKAWIEAKPGAEGTAFAPRKGAPPLAVIYKVMGKTFAILSLRGIEDVIVKCDPLLASALRNDYTGIGHRSHLDPRYWISVRLDADVPTKELEDLVSLSYDLVCAGLAKKQRAELALLASSDCVGGKRPAFS